MKSTVAQWINMKIVPEEATRQPSILRTAMPVSVCRLRSSESCRTRHMASIGTTYSCCVCSQRGLQHLCTCTRMAAMVVHLTCYICYTSVSTCRMSVFNSRQCCLAVHVAAYPAYSVNLLTPSDTATLHYCRLKAVVLHCLTSRDPI